MDHDNPIKVSKNLTHKNLNIQAQTVEKKKRNFHPITYFIEKVKQV